GLGRGLASGRAAAALTRRWGGVEYGPRLGTPSSIGTPVLPRRRGWNYSAAGSARGPSTRHASDARRPTPCPCRAASSLANILGRIVSSTPSLAFGRRRAGTAVSRRSWFADRTLGVLL